MATGTVWILMVAGCDLPFFEVSEGGDEKEAAVEEHACNLGARRNEVDVGCDTTWDECEKGADGEHQWRPHSLPLPGTEDEECDTPLAVEFGGATEWIPYEEVPGTFLLTTCDATDWPTHSSPWLAMDRNGNGQIDDGTELFGNASGQANGFEALASLDDDGDGVVDLHDEGFEDLLLWRDVDADRVSQPDELSELAQDRIVSIDLDYVRSPRCDARGNCVIERAVVYLDDGSTLPIVDLYPLCRESGE